MGNAYKYSENEACFVVILIEQLISFPQILFDDVYTFWFNLSRIFLSFVTTAF